MKRVINRALLCAMPKRTLTSCVGRFSRLTLSRHAIPWYIRHYQIEASESELPISQYPSLVDFFRRRLKEGARSIHANGIVSPVDGTVSELGKIAEGQMLQAKGCAYTLEALVGGAADAAIYQGGDYVTLYLSPRDYHRIHMPADGTLTRWTYIPGTLFPVNAMGVKYVQGLFTKNERLVTHVTSDIGRYAVIKVGATIVGSIRTPYGPEYLRPHRRAKRSIEKRDVTMSLTRGEEMGWFEFGSTVILVFEPGVIKSFTVKSGDTVRMGQQIGEVVSTML